MSELWSYVAAVEDVDKAATDSALAAVSGDFANLFSQPVIREADAPDLDPPRAWSTNVFVVDRPQRREIKNAIQTTQTLVYEEADVRQNPRYPSPSELFIAKYQWRFQPTWDEETQEWSHTYVHSTGLFKTGALSSGQNIGTDWALIDQWDKEQDMINTVRSGDGNRIEVVYDGRYMIDGKAVYDPTEQPLSFQWIVNTTPTGPVYDFPTPGASARPDFWEFDLVGGDKIGLAIKSNSDPFIFNLLQGSWMGLRRIN